MIPAAMTSRRFDITTLTHAMFIATAAAASYTLVTEGLSTITTLDDGTDRLGGMWAAVATLFCFRDSYAVTAKYALSRMSATLTSFVLCTIYLLLFPHRALRGGR
jgi:hypothetical protein